MFARFPSHNLLSRRSIFRIHSSSANFSSQNAIALSLSLTASPARRTPYPKYGENEIFSEYMCSDDAMRVSHSLGHI